MDFQQACDHRPFGDMLSVRKNNDEKVLMTIHQDEAIMKKNLFTQSTWCLHDGTQPLIPKDEGMGVMISVFTWCELGFGYTVPAEILEKVNKIPNSQQLDR